MMNLEDWREIFENKDISDMTVYTKEPIEIELNYCRYGYDVKDIVTEINQYLKRYPNSKIKVKISGNAKIIY